jgi:hypothetical protein
VRGFAKLLVAGAIAVGSVVPGASAASVHVRFKPSVFTTGSAYNVYILALVPKGTSKAEGKKLEALYRPRGKVTFTVNATVYPGGHFGKGTFDSTSDQISWSGAMVHKRLVGTKGSLRYKTNHGVEKLKASVVFPE